ncbi:MAG: Ig-like domain-containing protein [Tannerella sp.]|jgi:uncharacterized protein YjdB|nr:Ig-like domain-containing protein [Tannerella sp.]
MKKVLLLLISCMFISISMQAQNPGGVSLDHDTIFLNMNSDTILTATVIPVEAVDKSVTWGTDPATPAAITIDTTSTTDKSTCIVTGQAVGTAKVIVETNVGSFKDTCVIKVVIPITDMELNTQTMGMIVDYDSVLIAKIDPLGATDPFIKWESRDSSIVDIISTEENRYDTVCNISALKPGSTYIVAKVNEEIKDSCLITVSYAPIESFTLSHDSIKFSVGSDTAIIAQILPSKGTDKAVTWKSLNNPANSIIQITSQGYDTICNIHARGVGEAKIVAEASNGQRDTCVFTVIGIEADSMYLNKDTIILDITHNAKLTATVTPSNATNKSIIWTSKDALIVSLDTTSINKYDTVCTIKAGYSGETYIYAETVDGGFKDSCFVKVIVPVDSVVLSSELIDIDMKVDSVGSVVARFYPDSVTYKTLEWVNLDPGLARIDSVVNDTICYFTAMYHGVDTIYARTPDGIKRSRNCFIQIDIRQVDSVKINVEDGLTVVKDTILLDVADSFEMFTTVYPYNATNDTLRVFTDKTDLVDIDSTSTGVFVKALKEGTAIVYAVSTDGSNGKDSCIVRISDVPMESISLNKDTIRLYENNAGTLTASILPTNTTDKSVTWSSSNNGIVKITSTGTDTVCTFEGLKADTAIVRAVSTANSNIKDSCVIIVQEQFVFVESDTTSNNNGKIAFYLMLPDEATLIGSFELQLPKGFGLTLKEGGGYRTELEEPYKESSDLEITALNDSTYTFDIKLKASPENGLLRSAETKKKVMDIAYTIYDNSLTNNTSVFNVKFVNVDFKVNNEEEIKEDHTVQIKVYKDATGNEMIESQKNVAYVLDGRLYVYSEKAETVSVYSLNGSLIFTRNKADGQAVFDMNTPEKVLIVKGSSGWANKIVNQ